jgi:DinB family protein
MDPRLKKLQQEISSAMSGLPPEHLTRNPPGKWSIAEILEHLYLSYVGTTKGCNRVLKAGKRLATKPTWNQRSFSFVVVGLGYMPTGKTAPAVARPRGLDAQRVTAEILPSIAEMNEILALCETRFGARSKLMDHPILGPLSVREWRKLHLVHGLHHVKQIQRLRERLGNGQL